VIRSTSRTTRSITGFASRATSREEARPTSSRQERRRIVRTDEDAPTPIRTAAAKKIEPTSRSKRKTANAIANAALAWSLGKDGSCDRLPQT